MTSRRAFSIKKRYAISQITNPAMANMQTRIRLILVSSFILVLAITMRTDGNESVELHLLGDYCSPILPEVRDSYQKIVAGNLHVGVRIACHGDSSDECKYSRSDHGTSRRSDRLVRPKEPHESALLQADQDSGDPCCCAHTIPDCGQMAGDALDH